MLNGLMGGKDNVVNQVVTTNNEWYVYTHSLNGLIFYVGKGKGDRANSRDGRGRKWLEHVKDQDIEVEIVDYYDSNDKAYSEERALIIKLKPSCNCTDNPDFVSPMKGKQTIKTGLRERPENVFVADASSISKNDPNGSVMNSSPWSFRLNNYQKDIVEEAASLMGISRQAYLRHAATEYAKLNLGIG